ncbi:MAG: hypothetical protein P8Q99_09870 [Paracoccaceae bacterium]|nr:hypothetical protein [Paracoccaceae bacterium]
MLTEQKPPMYFYPAAFVALLWFLAMASLLIWRDQSLQFAFETRFLFCVMQLELLPQKIYELAIWAGLAGSFLLLRRSIIAPIAWAISFLAFLAFTLELWKTGKFDVFQFSETCFVTTTLSMSLLYYLYARAVKTRSHLI